MRAIPVSQILAVALALTSVAFMPDKARAQGHRPLNGAPALRIWTYVTGPLDAADRDEALEVARELVATAGVGVEWRTCGAVDACSRETDPRPNVTLILTSAIRATCGTAALERSGLSATVLISLPCIAQVVFEVTQSPSARSNPLLSTLEGRHLIGAAIAHEVGHVLGLSHARTGVMRARLDVDDMLALRRNGLSFSPREVALMRGSAMWQGLAASTQDDSVLESALNYFTRHDAGDIGTLFDAARPAPVSDAERGRSVAMLPAEGDLRDLDTAQLSKVASVRRVLALHKREAVYVIKVIAVPQAVVALHDRTVVLVSERALDLLDAEELQALVAHEVGHEYFWGEYFQGRRDNSRSSLRRLELLCDGIAVITLQRVGLNPERLTAALEKIGRYNRNRFGVALTEGNYPALSERRRFVGRLVEWLGRPGVH